MKRIETMNELSIENRIVMVGAIIAGFFMFSGWLVTHSFEFVLGVLMGSGYGMINFKLMQFILEKAVKMPPNKAQTYVQTRYIMRYFLTGVVIYLAIIAPFFNVIGVILGLIAIKLSILICKALLKDRP